LVLDPLHTGILGVKPA